MKISDFSKVDYLDIFVQRLLKRKSNKVISLIIKSMKENNIDNFYFNVLKNIRTLDLFNCFTAGSASIEAVNETHAYVDKLATKLEQMKNSEISNFVKTKILVTDFSGSNDYIEAFETVVDKYFGIRITKELIKEKYDEFNKLYFGSKLPNSNETDKFRIDLNRSSATRIHGNLSWRRNRLTGECYDYVLRINPNLKFKNEIEFDAIIIHEMIHLYCHLVLNDHDNYKGGHGYNFMRICGEINQKTNNIYNLNRYISHDLQRV